MPSESCRRIGGIPVDELTSLVLVLVLAFAVLYLAATLYRLISRR